MKNGREIIEKLGGVWRGDQGRSYCPAHQDSSNRRSDALSVKQAAGRVLITCFAGCSYREITAALSGFTFENTPPKLEKAKKFDSTGAAMEILRRSFPIKGTLAEAYLRQTRGLYHFDETPNLRFNPDVWHSREYGAFPALIAAIHDIKNGALLGCHVTFLNADAQKAEVTPVKKVYGKGAGKGVIVLRETHPSAPAIIAEGIESALSLDLYLAKDYSVYSCLNCNGLAEFHNNSAAFEKVIVAADKDKAGIRHAEYFAHFQRKKGRQAVIMYPPNADDWNDEILKKY